MPHEAAEPMLRPINPLVSRHHLYKSLLMFLYLLLVVLDQPLLGSHQSFVSIGDAVLVNLVYLSSFVSPLIYIEY